MSSVVSSHEAGVGVGPSVDTHHDHHHHESFISKYVFSQDHKMIAKQFLITGIIWAIIGGLFSVVFRLQLGYPDQTFPWLEDFLGHWAKGGKIQPEFYYALVTMHGTVLVFFVLTAGLSGTFANFLIPLQIGARDMASPLLNMLSYWFFFLASVIMISSLFVQTGPASGGWTVYPPLSALGEASSGSKIGMDLWLVSMAMFIVSSLLVIGSFYLSLNGAHRLIDNKDKIVAVTDSTIAIKTDSIAKYYDKEISFYRNQGVSNRNDRKYRDSIVNVLQITKDTKIKEIESKTENKSLVKIEELKQNDLAFAMMVFFLELIILIGVAFNAYYIWTSYDDMKNILTTPKYKQLELHLRLLKLYYQNGRKKEQDVVLSRSKLIGLVASSKIPCNQKDINNFISLCGELEIITGNRRNKVYNMSYEKAKGLLENQEL
jgi:hypothetical protein